MLLRKLYYGILSRGFRNDDYKRRVAKHSAKKAADTIDSFVRAHDGKRVDIKMSCPPRPELVNAGYHLRRAEKFAAKHDSPDVRKQLDRLTEPKKQIAHVSRHVYAVTHSGSVEENHTPITGWRAYHANEQAAKLAKAYRDAELEVYDPWNEKAIQRTAQQVEKEGYRPVNTTDSSTDSNGSPGMDAGRLLNRTRASMAAGNPPVKMAETDPLPDSSPHPPKSSPVSLARDPRWSQVAYPEIYERPLSSISDTE